MIELLLAVCLPDRPEICATRLVPSPAPCATAAAAPWAEAHGVDLQRARCAPLGESVAPLAVREVAPGVFVHTGRHELPDAQNLGDQANLGFVVGEVSVAVIDAGGSRAVGEALYAAIRVRTDLPIRWLVLTHMHPDHAFGAAVFREAGAEIVGHAKLAAGLAARADSYAATLEREAGPQVALASEIVLPDRGVEDRLDLDLGGRVLELQAHPTAHTDNDLSVFDPRTGTWFLGDLVFAGHLPTIDGSVLGWLDLLDALDDHPVDRIVPGHGPATLPWPDGAAPMRAYLAALVAETRAAIARGESIGEATRHLGTGLRGDWQLFDTFNARNATAAYRELEWE